jgi:nitroimidazol reductase NimA-like FMN-containing flavoprotein (pyridoxamine 5'-phosphate oxidase superfamily)
MNSDQLAAVLSDPVTVDLIEQSPLLRVAYTGTDGAPRVVPLAYLLRQGRFVFCTVTSSAKVEALRRDPRVALTIDVASPVCCRAGHRRSGDRRGRP